MKEKPSPLRNRLWTAVYEFEGCPMRVAVLSTVLIIAPLSTALAEDCEAPCVGTTVTMGLVEDYFFATRPGSLKHNSLYPEIGIESFIMPVEDFKLVSSVTIERVKDPDPGKNSTFQDIGGYVDELYAELTFDPVTLRLGKIEPEFSLAAADADGINANDLADNADVGESLGGAASIDFELAGHAQTLTGALFTVDRSLLAGSVFTKREVKRLSDGGAGNSKGISSASLVLDGCLGADVSDCHDEGDFGYRLGARYQRKGRQTEEQAEEEQAEEKIAPKNELAVLAAAQSNLDVGESTLRLMGEAAYLKNFEGGPDDAAIFTGIAAWVDGPLTYSAAVSRQLNFIADGSNSSASLAELAVVYKAETDLGLTGSKWSVGGAYAFAVNEDKEKAHALSLRLTIEFGGSYSLR